MPPPPVDGRVQDNGGPDTTTVLANPDRLNLVGVEFAENPQVFELGAHLTIPFDHTIFSNNLAFELHMFFFTQTVRLLESHLQEELSFAQKYSLYEPETCSPFCTFPSDAVNTVAIPAGGVANIRIELSSEWRVRQANGTSCTAFALYAVSPFFTAEFLADTEGFPSSLRARYRGDAGRDDVAFLVCTPEQVVYITLVGDDADQVVNLFTTTARRAFKTTALADLEPDSVESTMANAASLKCAGPDGEVQYLMCDRTSGGCPLYPVFPSTRPAITAIVYIPKDADFVYGPNLSQKDCLETVNSAFYTTPGSELLATFAVNRDAIPSDVGSCSIELSGRLTNQVYDGLRETSVGKAQEFVGNCSAARFAYLYANVEGTINNIRDGTVLGDIYCDRYLAELLQADLDWLFCREFLESMAVEGKKTVPVSNTSTCFQPLGGDAWAADPCCNSEEQIVDCCRPRDVDLTVGDLSITSPTPPYFSQCANPQCSLTLYSDILEDLEYVDCGSDPQAEGLTYDGTNEIDALFQECKAAAFGAESNQACSVFSRNCRFNYTREQEDAFLGCIVADLPPLVDYFFRDLHPPVLEARVLTPAEINSQIRARFMTTEYHLAMNRPEEGCVDACGRMLCTDLSCTLPQVCQPSRVNQICEREWGRVQDTVSKECKVAQLERPAFCGYCVGSLCTKFPDITSEEACAAATACITPDGQQADVVETGGFDAGVCEGKGACTLPCYDSSPDAGSCLINYPLSIIAQTDASVWDDTIKQLPPFSTRSALCVVRGLLQDECQSTFAGTWLEKRGMCIRPDVTTAQECGMLGMAYVDCGQLDAGACRRCGAQIGMPHANYSCPIDYDLQSILGCYWAPGIVPCADEAACTERGGMCDDLDIVYNRLAQPPSPFACVVTDRDKVREGCEGMLRTLVGCVDYDVGSGAECSAKHPKGEWRSYSRSEETCRYPERCYLQGQRLSLISDTELCDKCEGNMAALQQWRRAEWRPAQALQPRWYPPTTIAATPHLDLFRLYQHMSLIYAQRIAELEYNRLKCKTAWAASVVELLCDCSDEGVGEGCFTDSLDYELFGQGLVCTAFPLTVSSSTAKASFPTTAVDERVGCLSVSTLGASMYNFRAVLPPASLSTLFSQMSQDSLRSSSRFASVYNRNGAQVGEVVGDGVKVHLVRRFPLPAAVSSTTVVGVTVCIKQRRTPSDSDFSLPLLGRQSGNEVRPLGLPVTLADGSLCATMDLTVTLDAQGLLNTTYTLFPVFVLPHWQTYDEDTFDHWLEVLLYIIAALYSLVGVCALVTLVSVLWSIGQLKPTSLILVAITVFCLMRAIYFFLLLKGVLGNAGIVDYVLVELPTLVFFFGFTVLVWAWFEVVGTAASVGQQSAGDQRGMRILSLVSLLLFNLLLLIIFIVFAFIFEQVPGSGDNQQKTSFFVSDAAGGCGSRDASDASDNSDDDLYANNQSKEQFIVSVAYHSILVAFTLTVALGLLIYGWRLYLLLKETEMQKSQVKNKIFVVANICGIGFVLHCSYVMTLTLTSDFDTVPFTLVFIFLAELLPCAAMVLLLFPLQQIHHKTSGSLRSSTSGSRSK